MKIIKRLIFSLVTIIALAAVAVIGVYIYVRVNFGIDLFSTAGQLKTLSEEVDEATLCPNRFSDDDLASVKTNMDSKVEGLINYKEGEGYHGYTIDFSALPNVKDATSPIYFNERQAGALSQMVFEQTTGGVVSIGDGDLATDILQVDFSEISESGSANFNVVAKVELTSFKEKMNGFPFNFFKKYVPDGLYISSTVRVDKQGEGMDYTLTNKSFCINNLDSNNTSDLFRTLNAVVKIGSAEDLNMAIGSTAVNALIGTKENPGFAYSLRALGKKTFSFFATADGNDCFMIS